MQGVPSSNLGAPTNLNVVYSGCIGGVLYPAPCVRVVVASCYFPLDPSGLQPEMQSDARRAAEALGAAMTRPYSLAFKQKMIERLTGRDALSASQLSRQTGVRQQNLSRWLEEARSLPVVASDTVPRRKWTVEQKARVLAEAANLSGEALCAYLEAEGVRLVDFERWRVALEEDGRDSSTTTKRIRELERELARKEKALAEAAALLVLKKTISSLHPDEDDDTDEPSES